MLKGANARSARLGPHWPNAESRWLLNLNQLHRGKCARAAVVARKEREGAECREPHGNVSANASLIARRPDVGPPQLALKRGDIRMRIAQVSPLAEAVPPRLYGGTERVVSWLTEALVQAGHDVTLFASGDSTTTATFAPIVPQALRLAGVPDHVPGLLLMLDEVRRRAEEFDIIHFHVDMLQYPSLRALPTNASQRCMDASTCLTCTASTNDFRQCPWSRFQTRSAHRCRQA
jgi:hypothetical protein